MAAIVIDRTDLTSLNHTLAKLGSGSRDAIRLATNETLRGVVTDSVAAIREKSTIKATTIRQNFNLNNMTNADLSAHVEAKGPPVELINFAPTSVVRGINVRLFKSGSRDLVKHAFLTKFKSGHRSAVWRATRREGTRPRRFPVGKRAKVPSPAKRSVADIRGGVTTFQLPMHVLYGPRVPDLFKNDDVMDIVLKGASVRFQKRLEYQSNRLINAAR